MNLDDTIVAISSPPGAALRGIVRLSGPEAIRIADRLFTSDDGTRLQDAAETRSFLGRVAVSGSVKRTTSVGAPPLPGVGGGHRNCSITSEAGLDDSGSGSRTPCGKSRPPHRVPRAACPPVSSPTSRGDGTGSKLPVAPIGNQEGLSTLPAIVYLFRAPHSYTRQNVVELHLLGAPGVLALTVEACLAGGARRAEPGEFTARAYFAGAFDLAQVHAIAGMIAARSDHQLQAAERLLHGALGRAADHAREELADLLSLVEGALDFADEPIEFITPVQLRRRLETVKTALNATTVAGIRAERWGRLPRVLLSGLSNVGKSCLLNRLTGLDRAICASIAGTTRDVLSAPMTIGEMECLLVDVAGLNDAVSELDARIQAAACRAVEDADLVLCVVDMTEVANAKVPTYTRRGTPVIVVANKCDLLTDDEQTAALARLAISMREPPTATSATTGAGCQDLKEQVRRALQDREVDVHDKAIALMAEHRQALREAIQALESAIGLADGCGEHLDNAELVAVELRAAAQALGTLVGEDQTEEMLARLFSRFCIGK